VAVSRRILLQRSFSGFQDAFSDGDISSVRKQGKGTHSSCTSRTYSGHDRRRARLDKTLDSYHTCHTPPVYC